jgi:hypothetical protein
MITSVLQNDQTAFYVTPLSKQTTLGVLGQERFFQETDALPEDQKHLRPATYQFTKAIAICENTHSPTPKSGTAIAD